MFWPLVIGESGENINISSSSSCDFSQLKIQVIYHHNQRMKIWKTEEKTWNKWIIISNRRNKKLTPEKINNKHCCASFIAPDVWTLAVRLRPHGDTLCGKTHGFFVCLFVFFPESKSSANTLSAESSDYINIYIYLYKINKKPGWMEYFTYQWQPLTHPVNL